MVLYISTRYWVLGIVYLNLKVPVGMSLLAVVYTTSPYTFLDVIHMLSNSVMEHSSCLAYILFFCILYKLLNKLPLVWSNWICHWLCVSPLSLRRLHSLTVAHVYQLDTVYCTFSFQSCPFWDILIMHKIIPCCLKSRQLYSCSRVV